MPLEARRMPVGASLWVGWWDYTKNDLAALLGAKKCVFEEIGFLAWFFSGWLDLPLLSKTEVKLLIL